MKSSINQWMRRGGEYWILLLLMGLHVALISIPKRHVSLASSNLMTNLVRLEKSEHEKSPSLLLAGSSITGRLMEHYFHEPVKPVQNLGLDGCGSSQAIDFILTKKVRPKNLIIEINTLMDGLQDSFKTVLDSQSKTRMAATPALPFLQSAERPVDLFYDAVHEWKYKEIPPDHSLAWTNEVAQVPVELPLPAGEKEEKFRLHLHESISKLREQGTSMAFVLIPRSELNDNRHDAMLATAARLATEFGIPMFDLRKCEGTQHLSWTDGVHLTPTAAMMVVNFMENEIVPRLTKK